MDEKEVKQRLLSSDSESDGTGTNYDSCHEIMPASIMTTSINVVGINGCPAEEGVEVRPTFKVYWLRWYMLALYSLFGLTQSAVWNTWGPISTTSEEAFGWSDATIAWLSNWGCLSFVLTGLFFPWLMQVKGLRWATISSMFLIAAGCVARVFTSKPVLATILIHLGQCLNGMAGPVAMAAIPLLSSLWFPPKERVTASTIITSINSFGVAIPCLLGPWLVPGVPDGQNSSMAVCESKLCVETGHSEAHVRNETGNETEARIMAERADIMLYMYIECAWSCFLFLVILIYFPAKPHLPPCASAAMNRVEYWQGLWALRKKYYYLCMAFAYSISIGVWTVWGSVLNVNLKDALDIDQSEAGLLGFYSIVGGCVAPLLIMRVADYFARYMKLFILIMYILGSGLFIAFTLMLIHIVPYSTVMLYVTVIGGSTLINTAVPMMYELACELAYPTDEGTANGLLVFLNNICGLVFLAVFSFPNVGTMWMNWGLVGSCVVCIPLIALMKGRFNRLEVDECIKPEIYIQQQIQVHVSEEEDTSEDEQMDTGKLLS